MSRSGKIVVIEDDKDDQELMVQAIKEINVPNELMFFDSCPEALDFLIKTNDSIFLILSDMNLPKMTGAELKEIINCNEYLKRKAVPFVFLTTTADEAAVEKAYEDMSQGFFVKPADFGALKEILQMIITYWKYCKHPNA